MIVLPIFNGNGRVDGGGSGGEGKGGEEGGRMASKCKIKKKKKKEKTLFGNLELSKYILFVLKLRMSTHMQTYIHTLF